MQLTIAKATTTHLEDCKLALMHSRLGLEYFPSEEKAIAALCEGLAREEIYVALDAVALDAAAEESGGQQCLGFLWFIPRGAFHSFPYLHILAVKEQYRSLGIGKQLLAFFEQTVFAESSKAFLVVADFNPDAKRLYEKLGYRQVGVIPDLYKPGVTEFLMMKERS